MGKWAPCKPKTEACSPPPRGLLQGAIFFIEVLRREPVILRRVGAGGVKQITRRSTGGRIDTTMDQSPPPQGHRPPLQSHLSMITAIIMLTVVELLL